MKIVTIFELLMQNCQNDMTAVKPSVKQCKGFSWFCFCFRWQMPRGPPHALFCVPRGRKSDQFSLEPNRKHFPSQDAPWLSPVAPSVPHGSQFVVFFLYVREKPEEGDLFWIYALDSERVFAVCVLCSLPAEGSLTGFRFKLLMNDGRLGFPVSSACSCRTRTTQGSQDRATVSSETKVWGRPQ